jgi:aspartate-semialdehyde dehydrogenase
MAQRGFRVALVGAGAVGQEILHVLEERRFPVLELRVLASRESSGSEVEFRGEPHTVEETRLDRLLDCDVVLCAAPGVLAELLPVLQAAGTRLVDVTGELELDPAVPLHAAGATGTGATGAAGPLRAVPRGAAAGLGLVLGPLHAAAELERVTVLTLEPASGAGRAGVEELSEQTLALLGSMSGEVEARGVFPAPLAFDCLPQVGDLLEGGDTTEERRVAHVLRRLLGTPALRVEATCVRVPVFSGTLVCVHVVTSRELDPAGARELWQKRAGVRVLDEVSLPTSRSSIGSDEIQVGRIRPGGESAPGLAFVLAIDDLRRGSALGAVEAAESLLDTLP